VVEKIPLGVKVERILKGSPAKKYDMRAGDIIIKANDIELQDLDIYDAVDVIKGPAGTQVVLSILRTGEDAVLDITVVRQKVHIPSVEQEYFEDENLAYIAINMFGEDTAFEFAKAMDEVRAGSTQGLIIDVRDNGGGYLQSAVQILSEFIPEKEVLVKTRYTDSYLNQNYFSVNTGEIYDKKIVVLINENSASASEITA
jgi:carboxyl-terminal processing protease